MRKQNSINSIRQLIAANNLSLAIQQVNNLIDHNDKINEVILQSSRFQDIKKQLRLGLISYEEANLTKNQISISLLELLDEIEINKEQVLEQTEQIKTCSASPKAVIHKAEKIYNIEKIDTANFS